MPVSFCISFRRKLKKKSVLLSKRFSIGYKWLWLIVILANWNFFISVLLLFLFYFYLGMHAIVAHVDGVLNCFEWFMLLSASANELMSVRIKFVRIYFSHFNNFWLFQFLERAKFFDYQRFKIRFHEWNWKRKI